MEFENFAPNTGPHSENEHLNQSVFAAEKIIGPPPPAETAHFDTGPKFDYPPNQEVLLTYDPQVDENAKRVRITTIIAQPPRQ